jgi:hypothetical protein
LRARSYLSRMVPRAFRILLFFGVSVALPAHRIRAQQSVRADSTSPRVTADSTTCDSAVPAPMTFAQKASFYSARTFSIRTVLGASYAAGIAQWRGTPREWGAGISGYGRRDAAAYGAGVIRHTVEFGVGALFHEDPRFERSPHNGFTARTEDALHNTLFVRTDDGSHRVAWSRAVAALATGFAVNSWEPRRLHSTHHALMLSLAGALSYATGHVTEEFTPDIKQFLLRQTPRGAHH